MKPVWLIEADVFREASEPLKNEIRRQGMTCHVVVHRPAAAPPNDLVGAAEIPADAPVIFRGSHPLMRHIQLTRRWSPGGWCHFERLACSGYNPHFLRHLLNEPHLILPVSKALSDPDLLVSRFALDGQVFVRPDGVVKTFTGRVVDREGFPSALSAARYQPEAKVLVAEPREIGREWRLVVCDDAIVAASLYRDAGDIVMSPGCPRDVHGFATEALAATPWRPDDVFMMDVCESGDNLRIVELNSFSCSGLYACDLTSVVAAVSDAAMRTNERERQRPSL